MSDLFRLNGMKRHDPQVDAWLSGAVRLDAEADALFSEPGDELRRVARAWFDRLRGCGPDVCELIHDGCPVAGVEDTPFAYVNIFKTHVNLGFFQGAALDDPQRLLQGEGKNMRHVKLRLGEPVDTAALEQLIAAAYRDIWLRLGAA